jgi:DNA-directed RNA polymerase omega subunit
MRIQGLLEKAPDRYKLSIAVGKRVLQLQNGAKPLVDPKGKSLIAIALEEFATGKVVIVPEEESSESNNKK